MEEFLKYLSQTERISLTKFRCGNHKLPIITGRYTKQVKADRKCKVCSSDSIGDEFHYIFECDYFTESREKYIKKHFILTPNTLKMAVIFF